ncbi:molybdopterin-containing oxidoreductase family protein [Lentzea sp. NPDC054927]
MTKKRTICGICEASCGLIATVVDGKLAKIEPDADHPGSGGYACAKGLNFDEVVYDRDRVVHPLRRREDGTFEEVEWEVALKEISKTLRGIVRKDGYEATGLAWGNPMAWNFSGYITTIGMAAALKTKHAYSSSSLDINNYWAAAHMLYGDPTVNLLPDFANTDFALIIGANPMVSRGSMVTTGRIAEVLREIPKRGGRVVVIDPRRTETAKLFEHIAIRPGADAWLLGGIAKIIIDEQLYDAKFVQQSTTGFDSLRASLNGFNLKRVESETGIHGSSITLLARNYAASPRASVYGRCGASLGRHSTLTKYLIDVLSILTGNLDRRGGMIFGVPVFNIAKGARIRGLSGRGRWRTRVDGVQELMGTAPMVCMPREISTPGRGQLRGLIMCSANPVTSAPGSAEFEAALKELELLVCIDPYITETTQHAHWILPPSLWPEREQMPIFTQQQATVPHAQWAKPVINPPTDVRDDWWILDQISRRIGINPSLLPGAQLLGRIGFRPSPSAILNMILRIGSFGDRFGLRKGGLNRGMLQEHGGGVKLADECPVGVLHRKIQTGDGRIRLHQKEILAEIGRMATNSESIDDERLRLFSIRQARSHNSWLHNIPSLVSRTRTCAARINPIDASALGVRSSEDVRLVSDWGEIVVQLDVTDEIIQGAVGLTHGWGHGGLWEQAREAGGAGYNRLTSAGPGDFDRPSGNAVFNGILVRILPVRR